MTNRERIMTELAGMSDRDMSMMLMNDDGETRKHRAEIRRLESEVDRLSCKVKELSELLDRELEWAPFPLEVST